MAYALNGLIVIIAVPVVPLIILGIWYVVQKVRRRGRPVVEDEEASNTPGPSQFGF